MKRILVEALVVACGGLLVALAANALSPRGLSLERDYFPKSTFVATNSPPSAGTTNNNLEVIAQRLANKGLQLARHEEVTEFFKNPKAQQGLILFLDARDEAHYTKGHIPGAYQLDYYRPEPYLPEVLPAVQAAEKVIIYCNGGECEDSEFTAQFLISAGIPAAKLLIYANGFEYWKHSGMPVHTGARNSNLVAPPAAK